MTHYTDSPASVRVSFFKQSGKWYTDEAVIWTGGWDRSTCICIHDAFAKSLRNHFISTPARLSDMDAICLDPYHQNAHPIQIKNGGWNK